MKIILAISALSFLAAPAIAADEQVIETFESRAIGLNSFDISSPAIFNTQISGGTVSEATAGHPAHSGLNVYGGTSITLVTENKHDFSWPGIGAWVSGTDTIWLQAYEYNQITGLDDPLAPVSLFGGVTDAYLSVGTFYNPRIITKAVFFSGSFFTIDDLTLGIEGVAPGIPEPASWAMMLGGFGAVGGAMRYRRKAVTFA